MLVGDHVLGRGTSVVTHPEGDVVAYLESLRRVHDLGPSALYCGHGPELTEDPGAVLDFYLAHRAYREQQLLAALRRAPRPSTSWSPPSTPRCPASCGRRPRSRPAPPWPSWSPRAGCCGGGPTRRPRRCGWRERGARSRRWLRSGTSSSSEPAPPAASWRPGWPTPVAGCSCWRPAPITPGRRTSPGARDRRRWRPPRPGIRRTGTSAGSSPGRTVPVPRGRVVGGSSALNAARSSGRPRRPRRVGRRGQRLWSYDRVLRRSAGRGRPGLRDRPPRGDGPVPVERPRTATRWRRRSPTPPPSSGSPTSRTRTPTARPATGPCPSTWQVASGSTPRWPTCRRGAVPGPDRPGRRGPPRPDRGRAGGGGADRRRRGAGRRGGAQRRRGGLAHLLLLSGIGPAADLRAAGIDVVVDAPGVGADFTDHPHVYVGYRPTDPTPMPPGRPPIHGVLRHLRARRCRGTSSCCRGSPRSSGSRAVRPVGTPTSWWSGSACRRRPAAGG